MILLLKFRTMPRKAIRRNSAWNWLITPLVVLICLSALAFTLYVVYLDHQVREQFQGARWSLPAKVYARPLEIYPGLQLSPTDLIRELDRLGYVKGDQLQGAGAYAQSRKDRVEISSREFHFWDGLQPPRKLRVQFTGNRVEGLTDLDTAKAEQLTRLDPYLIGSLYQIVGEDRILVRLSEVPKLVVGALLQVEDSEFYDHFGVDLKAILRATMANVKAGRVVQGGSTITQQLVKNFFLTRKQTFGRKAREAIMALLLESHFGKDEILEAYMNEVYLGQDGSRAIHGFGLASHFYFLRPLSELRAHEVALLVALVQGPSSHDPRRHPERALKRRNLMLDEFAQAGLLTPEAMAEFKKMPLGIVKRPPSGTTQYPAFVDLVRRQLRGQYREADLASEGLRVFTTLDPRSQELAEEQLQASLKQMEAGYGMKKNTLQGAVVVTGIEGGEVLALVGDRRSNFSGFNRALDARRPIGSLVKPMVYLAALSRPSEFTPVTLLQDESLELPQYDGSVWAPQNYDKEEHGDVPLYDALAHSYNLATVRLALQVTPASVAETIKQLGFKGEPMAVPSIALGTVEMAPMEVAQVYNTIAAGGYYTPLLSIRQVTSRDGAPLSHYALQLRRVYDEASVYLLNWSMQKVFDEGTARSAYSTLSPQLRLAGKTGTTDDLRDSWFAGYSGNRLAVVWVGRDDYQPGKLTGAQGALQVWIHLLKQLPLEPFKPSLPDNVEFVPLDPDEPEHDDEDCGRIMEVPLVRGSLPEDMVACSSGGNPPQPAPAQERRPERERNDRNNWFLDIFR